MSGDDGLQVKASQAGAGARTIGPYLLLDQIGAGGMAEVYRAVRTGPEGFMRTFALKRIVPAFAASEDFVQMFCAEARVAALLHHPNIVQVHDFGTDEGQHYLVMEHLRGRTVLDLLRELAARGRSIAPTIAAYVARQVAIGLAYAHGLRDENGRSLDLVHRDVTPSNVMILRSGGVKLLDFGIVKAPTIVSRETQGGLMKGKFSYASPEQLRCHPLDGRSDVFSLGIVLWELLTQQKLFAGDTDFEIVQNAIKGPIPAPSKIRPDIPPALDEIVLRALARDRDARWCARELAAVLGEFLRAEKFLDDTIIDLVRDLWSAKSSQVVNLAPGVLAEVRAAAEAGRKDRATDKVRLATDGAGSARAAATPEEKSATPAALSPGSRPKSLKRTGRTWLFVAGAGMALAALMAFASFVDFGTFNGPPGTGRAASVVDVEPARVLLELDSIPHGARVYWGDKHLGDTPLALRLARGTAPITLRLERAGHQPLRYEFVPEQDAMAALELVKDQPARR